MVARTSLWVCLLGAVVAASGIKIQIHYDKRFEFARVHTWTWAAPAGKVIILRTADDDPEPIRQRFEPVVLDAVTSELTSRGLSRAESAESDLTVTYYLVVAVGAQTEYLGKNIPGSISWTLPPMTPATTRFEAVQRGTLVVDLASPKKQSVVWRGMAESKIEEARTDDQRRARIREAVTKVLKKYPPSR